MVAFAVFWILLLIGVPIFGVLLGTSLTGLAMYTSANLLVIPQQFYNGVNQQTLLAIPFFIVAGTLASRGKTSEYLVKAMCLVFGRIRGGAVIAAIAACAFFAAISGSSMATVVAVGGSGAGADTAIVLRPEASSRMLKTKVDRFICKPID